MNFNFRLIKYFLSSGFLFFVFNTVVAAADYVPLSPENPLTANLQKQDLAALLKVIFQWGVGIAVSLAILMIILGGVQYMTTDAIFKKEEGKKRITAAVVGLLISLSGWLILNQINPNIFINDLGLKSTGVGVPDIGGVGGGLSFDNINNIPGYNSGGSGNVAELTKNGTVFPDQSWNDYALQQVISSGLLNLTPSDAARYFPNGITAQGYVNLLASIATKESGFNPNTTFRESQATNGGVNSVGLLQLSYTDAEARAAGYSEQDLKDPYKNIEIGTKILARQIKNDGVISGQNSSGRWVGGTAYWSTLR